MDTVLLNDYIAPGKRVYLVGIGGVSMCALAEVLHDKGVEVSGSDISEGGATKHLRSAGIKGKHRARAENIEGADCVIRTAAVHEDIRRYPGRVETGVPCIRACSGVGRADEGV
jgi:UDP-N-acetylmuramate--alanine ligase